MSPEDRAKEEAAHQAFLAKAREVVEAIDAHLYHIVDGAPFSQVRVRPAESAGAYKVVFALEDDPYLDMRRYCESGPHIFLTEGFYAMVEAEVLKAGMKVEWYGSRTKFYFVEPRRKESSP